MWFEIALHKDYSLASCETVSESRRDGKLIYYIEASSKEEAISILLARYDRTNETHRATARARYEERRELNLCRRCGRNVCAEGLANCSGCLLKKAARRREINAGAPKRAILNTTVDGKVAAQLRTRDRDIRKAARKANGHYIMVRVAYARCLQAFDSMTPRAFRLWLSEQLHEAQAKERQSANRRNAQAEQKERRTHATAAE